ncbi:hypothetical protein OHB13_16600 [Streptomyces sp. NBC_00440]|uniref:hypothetical protein n=1 Tax=unclassified Streptomyces TaxID=2593676 RepID=UPI0022585DE8|nr:MULTISPECIES: hypothetical protein [unclassified Streptomyces]MCX4725627.1 hypothetical protein [Streptomyces sp. NBC_01306]WSX68903.1 hypothetical protein OG221_21125 [Streptomyces sp. NBC_00932]
MTRHPTPAEASRALQDVQRRREEALGSARDSRWVAVLFGLAVFALLAAPDFFGQRVESVVNIAFAAIAVAYAVLLRSRRGSAVLGRPTRVRHDAVSPRFALWSRVAILAVVVLGAVAAFVPHQDLSVPYARTVIGAVLGAVLILFGSRLQRGLASLAAGGERGRAGALDGSS